MARAKKGRTADDRRETETLVINAAYARLQARHQAVERLLHLFSDLSDPNRVLQEILDTAMEAVPCEAGSLLLTQGDNGELRFVAARGPVAHKLLGLSIARGVGFAGACARDHASIACSDVRQDPRHAGELSRQIGFEPASLLVAPVLHRGDLLGVIELINKKGGSAFALHEVETVERIGRAAGSLLYLMDALS
jgi:sigma-B regulation protein RsbU (phosphoserine phosphatase)